MDFCLALVLLVGVPVGVLTMLDRTKERGPRAAFGLEKKVPSTEEVAAMLSHASSHTPVLVELLGPGQRLEFDAQERRAVARGMRDSDAKGMPTPLATNQVPDAAKLGVAWNLYTLAERRFRSGQIREAAFSCSKAIAVDDEYMEPWLLLAEAFLAHGDPYRAKVCLDQCVGTMRKAAPSSWSQVRPWCEWVLYVHSKPPVAAQIYLIKLGLCITLDISAPLQSLEKCVLPKGGGVLASDWTEDDIQRLSSAHSKLGDLKVPPGLESIHNRLLDATKMWHDSERMLCSRATPYWDMIRALQTMVPATKVQVTAIANTLRAFLAETRR